MHSQLNYMIAQQRSTQLQRAGEHARLASDLLAGQRSRATPSRSLAFACSSPVGPAGLHQQAHDTRAETAE